MNMLADIGFPSILKVPVPVDTGLADTVKQGGAGDTTAGHIESRGTPTVEGLVRGMQGNEAVRAVLEMSCFSFGKMIRSVVKNKRLKLEKVLENVLYFAAKGKTEEPVRVVETLKPAGVDRKATQSLGHSHLLWGTTSVGGWRVPFQRVRELDADATNSITAGKTPIRFKNVRVKMFHYSSTHSSFCFRLEIVKQGGTKEQMALSAEKFRVVVKTDCATKAIADPGHTGSSLVAKVAGLIKIVDKAATSLMIREV